VRTASVLIAVVGLVLGMSCGGGPRAPSPYEEIFDEAVEAISRPGQAFYVRTLIQPPEAEEPTPPPGTLTAGGGVSVWEMWADVEHQRARLQYGQDDRLATIDIVADGQRALISSEGDVLQKYDYGGAEKLGNPALAYLLYLRPLATPTEERATREETFEGRRVITVEVTGAAPEPLGDWQVTNIVYLDAESLLPVKMIMAQFLPGEEGEPPMVSTMIYESASFIPLGELPEDFFSIEAFGEPDFTPVPVPTRE